MNIAIKESSRDKLKLVLKPTGCFLIGGGAIFIACALLVTALLGNVVRLTLANNEVRYERLLMGKKILKEFSFPASEVTELSLPIKKQFMSATYVVTIHTGDVLHEVELPKSDGDEKLAIIDQLNAELQKPDGSGSFAIEQDGVIFATITGGALLLCGLACLFSLQTVNITADREIGYLKIQRRRALLPISNHREIELQNFESITAEEFTVKNAGAQRATSYQVVIHQRDGKPLKVAHGPMFTEKSSDKLINLIESWLKGKPPRPN